MKRSLTWLFLATFLFLFFALAEVHLGQPSSKASVLTPISSDTLKRSHPLGSENFGTYMGGALGLYGPLENWRREAQLMNDAGIGIARFNADCWDLLEPNPNQFQWSPLDRVLEIFEEHHIEMLFTIPISSQWNSSAPNKNQKVSLTHYPCKNLKSLENFCEKIAQRYQGRIRYFEAWNEPDFGEFWKGKPDPKEYTETLKSIHKGLKKGNPECQILMGGLALPIKPSFLHDILSLGADQYFDIINFHIYVVDFFAAHRSLERVKETMENFKLHKSLWVTEISSTPTFFYKDRSRESEEKRKAEYLVRNYAVLFAGGVDKIFWHSLRNCGMDAGMNKDFDFALMTSDFKPLPVWQSFKHMRNILEGCLYIERLKAEDGCFAYFFKNNKEQESIVAWSHPLPKKWIHPFQVEPKSGFIDPNHRIKEVELDNSPKVFNPYGKLLLNSFLEETP